MDLAFTFLFVMLGIGAIVYAGLRSPAKKTQPDQAGDAGPPVIVAGDSDGGSSTSGGGE